MTRWKKLLALSFIGSYLCFLAWGTLAHTLKIGNALRPVNYFAVWDMFCGWSAWDNRTHIVAKGASGQFYELTEPWGPFRPFGSPARIHYDSSGGLIPGHIRNVLAHSDHEEIDRVYVVDEVWPKQYNLPPQLYAEYFDRPMDRVSYFHVRTVCRDDGVAVQHFNNWHTQQYVNSVYENPRIQRQSRQATSLYSTNFTPSRDTPGLQPESAASVTTN